MLRRNVTKTAQYIALFVSDVKTLPAVNNPPLALKTAPT